IAPRLWKIASAHGFLTVGDYLEYRYDRSVRRLIAGLLWLGALAILAGQLIAMAWILDVVAQAPKWSGCLLGGLVVTAYFSLGGLVSTAWVNVAQLIIKMAGFLAAVPFALGSAGGWDGLTSQLARQTSFQGGLPQYLSLTGRGTEVFDYLVLLVPSFLISPGILQKVYGARDSIVARNGVLLNATGLFLFALLPPLLGVTAHAFYPELQNRELALPTLMVYLMPPWLGALALAAVFSAELSAADAVLAMLSTSFARDLVQGYFHPDLGPAELLRVTRTVSIVAGLLGVLLAMVLPNVVSALQIFYGLLTVALFVPLVFGLYWKRPSARAGLVSIVAGVASTSCLQAFGDGKGIGPLSPVACGILAGAAAMTVMALWRNPAAENSAAG
ncbi:MAG: sodium:solute symporter family protein, partial [Acidobacteria bacterium]|nr:sodium:solute symporter family protein [Acidobacteriota bacterium]